MAEPPSKEELVEAVGKLKSGKAGGSSGILPEMVKAACCREEFLDLLLDLSTVCGETLKSPKIGLMQS